MALQKAAPIGQAAIFARTWCEVSLPTPTISAAINGSRGTSNTADIITSNRMLKKSASGVLASLRGSTYRSVRLAPSLAAALLDSLFEHPEVILVLAHTEISATFGINQVLCSLLV